MVIGGERVLKFEGIGLRALTLPQTCCGFRVVFRIKGRRFLGLGLKVGGLGFRV